MPNVPIRATGEAVSAVSRRAFLRTTASAGIATAAAGGALAVEVASIATEPADPLLTFLNDWRAAEQHYEATVASMPGEACDAFFDASAGPYGRRCFTGDMPAATTAAGAAAALRKILDLSDIEDQPQDVNLLRAALTYLDGKVQA